MSKAATATIDHAVMHYNLALVNHQAPGAKVMAVVKANAYGHGMLEVAKTLHQSIDAFGVACLDEAMTLRATGVLKPVVVLSGFLDLAELELASNNDLSMVIHHVGQIEILAKARLAKPICVWLKVDTGMHRLGVGAGNALSCYQRLQQLSNIMKPIGLMSHLAYADDRRDPRTKHQYQLFNQIPVDANAPRSIANSAGILGWSEYQHTWVRPGIMLYGVSPFTGRTSTQEGLKPAMTLSTSIISIQPLRKGQAVGYGGTWVAPSDRLIGIAAVGYGDGYPRHAPSGTPVLVNGKRASLVGRVSMDMICLDLQDHINVNIGDSVVLWGDQLPIEEVARMAQTIPYELMSGLTTRVQFRHQNLNSNVHSAPPGAIQST